MCDVVVRGGIVAGKRQRIWTRMFYPIPHPGQTLSALFAAGKQRFGALACVPAWL